MPQSSDKQGLSLNSSAIRVSAVDMKEDSNFHKKTSDPIPIKVAVTSSSEINSSASSQSHTAPLSSSHPKKKSGFVITSVKDNVDGEESADDLDGSPASNSGTTFVRADHDQESCASEGNPISMAHSVAAQSGSNVMNDAVGSAEETGQEGQLLPSNVTTNALINKQNRKKKHSESHSDENAAEQFNNEASSPEQRNDAATDDTNSSSKPNLIPTQNGLSKSSGSEPKTAVTTSASTAPSSAAGKSVEAKPVSPPSLATAKGAERVYKVVTRETGQPLRRDAARWICFDYGDGLTPHLSFIPPHTSEPKQSNSTNQIPSSASSTSVPASPLLFNLQHSDSVSSDNRDGYFHGVSTGSVVQHSASASSISNDLGARKLSMVPKGKRKKSVPHGDRLPKEVISEQEVFKNGVMESSDEVSNSAEQEDEGGDGPTATGQIDIKIEAVMDLVKKHLKNAVLEELDELRKKIKELTKRNEMLVAILQNPDQHTTQHTTGQPIASQGLPASAFPQQPAGASVPTADLVSVHSHVHSHTVADHSGLSHKHALPSGPVDVSPPGAAVFPGRGQVGSSQQPQILPAENISIPNALLQQAVPPPQVLQNQQQTAPQGNHISRSASYQHNQQLFSTALPNTAYQQLQQPVVSTLQQQQPGQLSPQQLQFFLQMALQQMASQYPQQTAQQGFQSPQVLMQQLGLPQQPQPLLQPFQQQPTLQPSMPLQSATSPHPTQPISQAQQAQFTQTTQSSVKRPSIQVGQSSSVPRQQSSVTIPVTSAPPVQVHHPVPASLHGQQQPQLGSVQSSCTPIPSAAPQTASGSVLPDQKPPTNIEKSKV